MDVCDKIYVFDQASDDGSIDVLRAHPKVVLIESSINRFSGETLCKKELLEKLLAEEPGTNWIFWMDCDTLLCEQYLADSGKGLREELAKADIRGDDALLMGHHNLWRSDLFIRVDNQYDWLHRNGVCCLWRNNGKLAFPDGKGLHEKTFPNGIEKTSRLGGNLIHRGFSTDYQIITKFDLYKSHGQSGWALDRLLDEKTLKVLPLAIGELPSWYQNNADKTDPRKKTKILDIYGKKNA